ncbi:MAG: hypothetical protein CVU79_12890 [Elusimicrobia bacterium HGW-Elusimicrobia-3]|nr:MAG: hypothetical protein CVU79_12890 [Elusimicrobia bacterium HGW-Elusimicrobia-3]
MNMKNTKAVFFIVLGAFLMATGFAFAAPSATFNKALSGQSSFDGNRNSLNLTVGTRGSSMKSATSGPSLGAKSDPTPEKVPTAGEKIKKFVGANSKKIISAAAIGFLGFLMFGTAGVGLAIGAAAFGFFFLLAAL